MVVEFGIAVAYGLGGAIGFDGAGLVELDELDAEGVELVVFQLAGVAKLSAGFFAAGAVFFAHVHGFAQFLVACAFDEAEGVEDFAELIDGLVGAAHDLGGDGNALVVVRI